MILQSYPEQRRVNGPPERVHSGDIFPVWIQEGMEYDTQAHLNRANDLDRAMLVDGGPTPLRHVRIPKRLHCPSEVQVSLKSTQPPTNP